MIIIIIIIIIITITSYYILPSFIAETSYLEVKGIKIGFLGYCDTSSIMGLNCTEITKL